MKYIIAGSRTIRDFEVVIAGIRASGFAHKITEVVSGASQEDVDKAKRNLIPYNVDIIGAVWALSFGHPVTFFPAKWDDFDVPGAIIRYHNDGSPYVANAGPIRNGEMADYGEGLILVWTGNQKKSKGSWDMLKKAKARNLPYFQHIVKE